jgi:hypothetical protein
VSNDDRVARLAVEGRSNQEIATLAAVESPPEQPSGVSEPAAQSSEGCRMFMVGTFEASERSLHLRRVELSTIRR